MTDSYRAWWFDPKKQTLTDGLRDARQHFGDGLALVNPADLGDRAIPGVKAQEPGQAPKVQRGYVFVEREA